MRLRSGLAITVGDDLVERAVIPVKNTLTITIFQYAHIVANTCHVDNPAFVMCKLNMIDPAGNQSEVGRITNADLYSDGKCLGNHAAQKTFSPLQSKKGNYVFIFSGDQATVHPPGGEIAFYPAIKIVADGHLVVDKSYPSPGGEHGIVDNFVVTYL
jgi:hypothetical protein